MTTFIVFEMGKKMLIIRIRESFDEMFTIDIGIIRKTPPNGIIQVRIVAAAISGGTVRYSCYRVLILYPEEIFRNEIFLIQKEVTRAHSERKGGRGRGKKTDNSIIRIPP